MADRNPDAPMQLFEDVEWVDIIPGAVEFGIVQGDFMTGSHGAIVRVQGGMGASCSRAWCRCPCPSIRRRR